MPVDVSATAPPPNTVGLAQFLSITPDVLFPAIAGAPPLVINQGACDAFILDLIIQVDAAVAAAPAAIAAVAPARRAAAIATLPGLKAAEAAAYAIAAAGGSVPEWITAKNAVSVASLTAAATVNEFILHTPMTRAGLPPTLIRYTFQVAFDQLLYQRGTPLTIEELLAILIPINRNAIARGVLNPADQANLTGCLTASNDVLMVELKKINGLLSILVARAPVAGAFVQPQAVVNPHLGALPYPFHRPFYEKYLKYKKKYLALKEQLDAKYRN